jgi:hypothetical protein
MTNDSLVISGIFELMGGPAAVQSDLSELVSAAGVGATFRLLTPDSGGSAAGTAMTWDLGAPQPTTDIVQSLLLDGERPFGVRASNRTITLPILIRAPDFVTLAAARELLMQAVDMQTWELAWTPGSTGLSQVFDCFRALPTVYSYGFMPGQLQPISVITLAFQALPYGRTDPTGLQNLAFASPLVGGVAAPPAAVVIDNFSVAPTGTNFSQSSTQFVVGPHSAKYTAPAPVYPYQAAVTGRTGLSLNITGLPSLSVWLGVSWDTAHYTPLTATHVITLRWTLTDNSGHKLTFSRQMQKVPWSNNPAVPKWTRVTAAIPQGNASFNYNLLSAYSVRITNWAGGGTTSLVQSNIWLDDVVANPPSLASPASLRGITYTLMGVMGTARSPFTAQFQLPQSGVVTQQLTGTGVWWPPVGVTAVKAECTGAGGSGGARTTTGFGGGGGGGEYAMEPSLTVVPGTPVPFSCGSPGQSGASQVVVTFSQAGTGSWTCPAGVTTVLAECWGGGATGAAGGGGGGGGEYAAEPSLAVTPGKVYQFTVGRGGTLLPGLGSGGSSAFPGDSVTVVGHNGLIEKGGGTIGGAGGTGSSNTTHHNGGTGGASPSYGGGGGGSSGYSGGAGTTGSAGSGFTGGAGGVGPGGDGGAGASAPGFPVTGVSPGGGGGGGYNDTITGGNFPGANGAPGQVQLTYTVAAGSPVAGGNTTFGSAGTTGTIVTAHGGSSAALNSATGAAGGTGSGNNTVFHGGAGFTASGAGGGGGGSGGSAAVGTAATSSTGSQAVEGGGKGGNGAAVANTNGLAASPPGGGGGGSDSTGNVTAGGNGGGGSIIVSHSPPLAPFGTLIAHRPGLNAPQSLNPCVAIANTADPPMGVTQYSVPSLISGQNALFNGTYTVIAVAYSWDTPANPRQVAVTVNQFEYAGGNSYPLTVTRTFTPATDITNGIVMMGELTLPVKDIDPSSTSAYFTVTISDTDQNDQFLDILFLDTQGQTVIVNVPFGNTYSNFYLDEPTADRDLGYILGSDLDRSQAVSVLDAAIVSGGPFYLLPGDNLFFAYSPSGAPSLGVTYSPRWFLDRLILC